MVTNANVMMLPGSTIGILGGGQLGRMLCLDARRMGYRTVVWSGGPAEKAEPTQGVADLVINEPFDSESALNIFCQEVDVATVEFENIPLETMRAVAKNVSMRPSADSVGICQRRVVEKSFLREQEIPCAPFEVVDSLADLEKAYAKIGPKAVLKTAAFGYDGKGQVLLKEVVDLAEAWKTLGGQQAVLEGFVDFECEVSVIVARGEDGEVAPFPVVENQHRHHMLDMSIVPARIEEESMEQCFEIAIKIAEAMDYVGLLAVEFFVLKNKKVLVNEMAPRPHNSGHFTMDGCMTSQFEQQLRAVCGLPLGANELLGFTVMINLLGDMWRGNPRRLNEEDIMESYGANLHLYGKTDPGERRKMGHVNLVGDETVLEEAYYLKGQLLGEPRTTHEY